MKELKVWSSAFLLGFTAISSQIVLARQILSLFYGNEISIGFMLFSWLLGGGVGSLLFPKILKKVERTEKVYAGLIFALVIYLFSSQILAEKIKSILGLHPGEITGFSPMALGTLIITFPLTFILGSIFPLLSRMVKQERATGIGKIYYWEAIGSSIGGVISAFFLISLPSILQSISILSLLNLSIILLWRVGNKVIFPFSLFLLSLSIFFCFPLPATLLEKNLLQSEWKGYKVLHIQNSVYGKLMVTQREEERSFFYNGIHLYSFPDLLTAEINVHIPLLEHPHPQKVLMIGGLNSLQEVLKHPLKEIDYVELDPLLITTAQRFHYTTRVFEDARLHVIHTDGRLWVRKSPSSFYDVVILCVGDPYTAQINRYYTLEFFQQVRRILKEKGVFSFGVSSSENYISREQAQFLSSLYQTLKMVFPQVKITPGDTALFLASPSAGILTLDYKKLERRRRERGVETLFIRDYFLFSQFSPERLSYIEKRVVQSPFKSLNRDFKPITYYFDIILWSTHFSPLMAKVLSGLKESQLWWIILGSVFLIGIVISRRQNPFPKMVLFTLATTGFSEISFQILVIVAFQIIFGFLYYRIGFIFTTFMIGLTVGSMVITRVLKRLTLPSRLYCAIQFTIFLYPLLLPPIFKAFKGLSPHALATPLPNLTFSFLPIFAGFIGGLQFPLAVHLSLKKNNQPERTAGSAYGADLIGSCVGSILISSLLIPILGLLKTCYLISLINLIGWVFLVALKERR